MEDKKGSVPYIVFESAMDREERTIKRLCIIIVALIFTLVLTIGIGVWYISLPVDEYINQEVDDIKDSHITQNQKVGD